jgi:hypothetical protein
MKGLRSCNTCIFLIIIIVGPNMTLQAAKQSKNDGKIASLFNAAQRH